MDTLQILPDIGLPVSSPAFDETKVEDMSIGEVIYAATFFAKAANRKLADPVTAHEFATFITESGADWSGHTTPIDEFPPEDTVDGVAQQTDARPQYTKQPRENRPIPKAPERYYDTMPAIAHMLRQQAHASGGLLTFFARQLEPALEDQSTYLQAPVGIRAFKDGRTYFREVLACSWSLAKKIHDRLRFVTWVPGADADLASAQPTLPNVAQAFAAGHIPAENLDRIISMDQDMTTYAQKTGNTPDYKDAIMAAFDPTLAEAAATASPDEFSQAKTRWAHKIAHAIDPDGPPLTEATRKPADNAIRTKSHPDGSGTISMHATAPVYALFKNFSLQQLNLNGTPADIPHDLLEILATEIKATHESSPDATDHDAADAITPVKPRLTGTTAAVQLSPDAAALLDNLHTVPSGPAPEAPGAIDTEGQIVTNQDLDRIELLTTGQRLGAIMIGMFQNLITMDPTELGVKKAHGATSQLVIVQDIQTAYQTLGIQALPEAIRRPSGPAGVSPPRISRPNPDAPDAAKRSLCGDPAHSSGAPPWTPYISEALNIGPMHQNDVEQLCCDSELVGQIWNDHHTVLDQRRTQRLFTPTQRRTILARDRGCQAPGCTIPAVYSQIHHIIEWLNDGPTDVDNAITLCAHHHAAVHNGKWIIRKHHGALYFQPAPWLDPDQPLLRNLYWAL